MEEGINSPESVAVNTNIIRERVDSNKTLPEVKLEISTDNMPNIGTLASTKFDLKNGDEMVGKMSVTTDKIGHISWINQINIGKEYQGKIVSEIIKLTM